MENASTSLHVLTVAPATWALAASDTRVIGDALGLLSPGQYDVIVGVRIGAAGAGADRMLLAGYAAEAFGPDGVASCASPNG
jgi:hypothetical protein